MIPGLQQQTTVGEYAMVTRMVKRKRAHLVVNSTCRGYQEIQIEDMHLKKMEKQMLKLRRGGKRRSYSKRFSVDNFDINGDVYYKRKSMGLGSDSESAKHIKIKVTSDSDSDRENSLETDNSKSRSRRSDSQMETTVRRNTSQSTVGEPRGL
ncbi:unnamed protein product [Schistosoma mattheei]|uniref:Uncharacterized protein n=1 Tax=Schistosoma mattheei TaxID=31246 RepID=A0AA85BQW9_9TREM|nr:unnamed protein product [Schistosoma mattheei]